MPRTESHRPEKTTGYGATLPPDLRAAFEASWARDEAAYRYLAARPAPAPFGVFVATTADAR